MICAACRQARLPLLRARLLSGLSGPGGGHPSRGLASTAVAAATTRPAMVLAARGMHGDTAAATQTCLGAQRRRVATQAATPPAAPADPDRPPLEKPAGLDAAEAHIWDVLAAALDPVALSVRDISGGCGSMYGIAVCSERFRGVPMLKQQRMVNAALGDLVKDWHGVQLKTQAP